MRKKNMYPTTCITCGVQVPAGHGEAIRITEVKAGGVVDTYWQADCRRYGVALDTSDDDGYDAMKDRMCESGEWFNRKR